MAEDGLTSKSKSTRKIRTENRAINGSYVYDYLYIDFSLFTSREIDSLLEKAKDFDLRGKINAKVEDTLNVWFGVEYKMTEG